MSIARSSATSLFAVVSVALVGCGSVGRLDPSPPRAIDLTGSWVLDRAASEDPQPLIEKLRPKPGNNRRGGMLPDDETGDGSGQSGGPSPGGGQQGGPRGGGRSRRGGSQQTQGDVAYRNNNEAYTHIPVMKMLQADVARAENLTIRQSPDRFSLDYGTTVRTFTPGAVSVVSAAWGVADQSSGWKGKEYVIQVKPQQGVAAVEKYGLSDDGKHLVEQLRLGGGDFPVVQLKRVYDHTDRPLARAVPTND